MFELSNVSTMIARYVWASDRPTGCDVTELARPAKGGAPREGSKGMLEAATEGVGAGTGAKRACMAAATSAGAKEVEGEKRNQLRWIAIPGAVGFGAGTSCNARPVRQQGSESYIHASACDLPSPVNGRREPIGREPTCESEPLS